jgi:GTPase SAR1 family protein
MLLGNKCDLPNREVPYNVAMEYARSRNFGFLEVSAKAGTNIKNSFHCLVRGMRIHSLFIHSFTYSDLSLALKSKGGESIVLIINNLMSIEIYKNQMVNNGEIGEEDKRTKFSIQIKAGSS